ncbi:MAG: diacylglycerol kinase family protein [Daejeonella sp.]|uniref:diacylglycerol/lipid kinase family protein n=1 Tax=Daejeonella sp. TaxID=2805397 RepID=UPI0027356B3C|nr:diacylglycerol kinase family protein [Daejeonella sp.]MDP3466747.1 diacylglycerol kinase family protein [Daejeonella sp.]
MPGQKKSPATPLRILFVINPKSGHGGERNLKKLISWQSETDGFDYQLIIMSGDDKERISNTINQYKPDIVAAAGGDGTINLMAGILAHTGIPLAIIPQGSANGMAKELHIQGKTESALEILVKGKTKAIDLIKINDRICIHLADVGLNARVVKRFEKDPKRGILTYARHLFGEMFLLKKYVFNISCDGKTIRRKGVSITFANASQYGTGAVINPKGILDDGKFELVIIKPFPPIKLLSITWKMFMNKLHTSDYVEIISCVKAQVISSRKTTLQVDGEVLGKVKEISIECLHKALLVKVP